MTKNRESGPLRRPTSWWLGMLRRRAERMYEEKLDLGEPIVWASEAERQAAIAFFNAAFRAEESGLRQAHELADEIASWDPELAECLRLYGDEEGWHRELITEFLAYLGGEVRPMGRVTGTFYRLYGRAKRIETIVLTNLMFETIGSTTYRLALRRARHPAVRHMLTILTRDESFHVPLNVHFLRETLARNPGTSRLRLQVIHDVLFVALLLSSYASRRRAEAFDHIPFRVLCRGYAEHLARLFVKEDDLRLHPPRLVLWLFGLTDEALREGEDTSAVSVRAAEAAVDRERVAVTAL
ncbi:ferritin-like domain-containing protein [Polyangium sp. 6x1]|uniref:ferritin-like domain-containing protein n=1 Tax=Polyangium sp. 6x1 TaxID=3042689 RepID=UPI00248235C5|nr:ferritin-like domain-containing protein [Polyangium sp. 6x1]MDI1448865.1 ferritin-like domain-containing protein [Polyangium sp. 6x1]